MKILRENNGTALVLALLTMLVLTILSLVAATKTGQGLGMSTEFRNITQTLNYADGGSEFGTGLIVRAMGNNMKISSTDSAAATVDSTDTDGDGITDLEDELMGTTVDTSNSLDSYSSTTPDVQLVLAGSNVNMDIDFSRSRQLPGSSSEFSSRYEGIGAGSSGGVALIYKIEANNQSSSDREATVRVYYRCIEGGGRCL